MSDTEQAAAPPEKKKNWIDEMLKYRLSQVILAHVNKLEDGSLVLQDDWSDEKTLEQFPDETLTIRNVKHQRERLNVKKPSPPSKVQPDVALRWLEDRVKELLQVVGSIQVVAEDDQKTHDRLAAIERTLDQHLEPWIKAKKVNSSLDSDAMQKTLKALGDRINEMNQTFASKLGLLEKRVAALEPEKQIVKEKETA